MSKSELVIYHCEEWISDRKYCFSAVHAAQHHSEGRSMVIVRIPEHDEITLSTALDAGASGIVIPHCEDVEEIKKVVDATLYRKRFSLCALLSELN
jgi:4-hydroxy-2-oxoheptanedioate aldolase